MPAIYCLSGPCGAGKTTLSATLADHLSCRQGGRQVCLLHGDDFHRALIGDDCSPAALPWPEVLRFNWDCLLSAAGHALARGMDVVIDYIVEDELPRLARLAEAQGARLHYAVLTAQEETLRERLTRRGDPQLIGRALILRAQLLAEPVNAGRVLDSDALTPPEMIAQILALPDLLQCDIDSPAADGVS